MHRCENSKIWIIVDCVGGDDYDFVITRNSNSCTALLYKHSVWLDR